MNDIKTVYHFPIYVLLTIFALLPASVSASTRQGQSKPNLKEYQLSEPTLRTTSLCSKRCRLDHHVVVWPTSLTRATCWFDVLPCRTQHGIQAETKEKETSCVHHTLCQPHQRRICSNWALLNNPRQTSQCVAQEFLEDC